jgi:hypothetical protein
MAVFKFQLHARHADATRPFGRPPTRIYRTNPFSDLTNRNICYLHPCEPNPFRSPSSLPGLPFPPLGAKTQECWTPPTIHRGRGGRYFKADGRTQTRYPCQSAPQKLCGRLFPENVYPVSSDEGRARPRYRNALRAPGHAGTNAASGRVSLIPMLRRPDVSQVKGGFS